MSNKYRKEGTESYSLGATVTFELLKHKPQVVEKVYVNSLTSNDILQSLQAICACNKIIVEKNDKIFHILSEKENVYVIGMFKKYYDKIDSGNRHIVLVNPSNSGNLGTILRSALGFGISNIGIIAPAVDVFDPKVIRASMGSVFSVKVQYFETIDEYVKAFKEYKLYSFMLTTENDLRNIVSNEQKISLIFGNESSGLPPSYAGFTTAVKIHHSNNIDSLNLQSAISIVLYQFTKDIKFSDN